MLPNSPCICDSSANLHVRPTIDFVRELHHCLLCFRLCAAVDQHAEAVGDQHAEAVGDQHAEAVGDQHAEAVGDQPKKGLRGIFSYSP